MLGNGLRGGGLGPSKTPYAKWEKKIFKEILTPGKKKINTASGVKETNKKFSTKTRYGRERMGREHPRGRGSRRRSGKPQ